MSKAGELHEQKRKTAFVFYAFSLACFWPVKLHIGARHKMGKNIVSKSNELIEMRLLDIDRPLGLSEMKVANAIYSKVSPNDEDFKPYALSVQALAELAGLDRDRLYQEIDRVTSRLCGTVVKARRPNNDGFLKASLFSTAEYIASEEIINFKIAPDLIPYLLRLKDSGCGFTQYYLEQTTCLQSKHSLRLYELLRQFLPLKKVKEGVTSGFRRVSVADLKEYLGIKDRYPKFFEFRRCVLEPAQKELAEKTDLLFEFTPERTRRTITGLNFAIRVNIPAIERKKAKAAMNGECEQSTECRDPDLLNQLVAIVPTLTTEQAVLLVNTYSREVVMESLVGLLAMLSSGQIKTMPAKYLMGILKNKRREEAQAPARQEKTTEEKLTDRSWAEGLQLEEWD